MFRVLLDVDGVLADTHRHIAEVLGLSYDPETFHPFEVEDWLGPELGAQARELMKDPNFWMTLPVMPGAQEGVQKMRDRNYKVFICTAPYRSCALWYTVRLDWLKEHFDIHPDDVVFAKQKFLVGTVNRFLDDRIDNVIDFSKDNIATAFLFNSPTNVNEWYPEEQRVDWSTIEKMLPR